ESHVSGPSNFWLATPRDGNGFRDCARQPSCFLRPTTKPPSLPT
uniref:Uncharacterized protein n=1 Tax=Aegilops tauschii subsp. strangulata TaxID=200361 RepID=A0A453PQI1_AEGTS